MIPIAVEQAYNSIKFTKKFLSVLPHVKLSFNQVFKTCNADVVRKLRWEFSIRLLLIFITFFVLLTSEAEDDSERKTALSYLERLLSSIGECDEKEQKKLFDSVVQAIQDFCNLDTVEISLKINVLQLLRKVYLDFCWKSFFLKLYSFLFLFYTHDNLSPSERLLEIVF